MIKFTGALAHDNASGREYTPRGVIWIRKDAIIAYYDHTILLQGHKIRVMETLEEIQKRVRDNE